MKNCLTLFLVILPLFSFSQMTKKVLLIGIDGCRPDALEVAATPNLDQLIASGIYSPHALNEDITISGPGWSSIICGVRSDKHLVTGNNFDNNDYENYPPFIKYVEEFNPEFHTVSICHWNPINDFIMDDIPDFKLNVATDQEVGNQASAYLEVNDPDVLFLHFDDVDHAGHADGFSPDVPSYISAIEDVDAHVGTVISALEQRPNYEEEDWLILVTTDHGGLGTSHGGNSIEERMVFVIAAGNSVATETILRDSTIMIDNPENCLGENIELKFDGQNDYVQVPPNSIFDFGADQDFTIECRVRTNNAADVSIVGDKDWDSGNNKGFVFSFRFASGPEWKVNIGDGNNRADINTGGSIADNEWHTLSVSFNRDGMMRMYEDGSFIDETDISNIGDITTEQGLFFGTDINSAYDYTGAIAEVRIWNTVLSDQSINDWSCESITDMHPSYNNLIGYWKLTETSGTTVSDSSPNNNVGQISSAQWQTPDSIINYNYDETPRLVDIPSTALRHLCIPIQESWNLDGLSLIPECSTTNTQNILEEFSYDLYPNPARSYITLQSNYLNLTNRTKIECYNATGQKVLEHSLSMDDPSLNISNLPIGIYYTKVTFKGKQYINRFVVN